MAVVAGSLTDTGRLLLACLAPITGRQLRVKARVTAAPGSALLPGTFLLPDVGGLRDDLPLRVAKSGARGGRWQDPGVVELVSNVGGERHNVVEPGTVLRFDPLPPSGFEPTVEVVEVLEAATDPTSAPLLLGTMMAQSAPALGTVELWRSFLGGRFPAALAVWHSSEPAAGLATSTLERGDSRVGEGRQLYAENWAIMLVVAREDSAHARRDEGLILLDEASELLTDRKSVDGCVFSFPTGVQIRRRHSPSFTVRELAQTFQVFEIDLATTRMAERRDERTYHELKRFKVDAGKHVDDVEAEA